MKNKSEDYVRTGAKSEVTQWRAIRLLCENNDIACEISIAGMRIGLCENAPMIKVCDAQIKEIQKFLDGKQNLWE